MVITLAGITSSLLSIVGLVLAVRLNGDNSLYRISIPIQSVGMMLSILIPVSVFISSIIVNLGLYARSVKEGNSYTTPLYLGVIFLGLLTTIDGFDLTRNLYYVPILNTIFMLKSILMYEFNMQLFWTTIISTILLTAVSIYFSVKLCENEQVLFRT